MKFVGILPKQVQVMRHLSWKFSQIHWILKVLYDKANRWLGHVKILNLIVFLLWYLGFKTISDARLELDMILWIQCFITHKLIIHFRFTKLIWLITAIMQAILIFLFLTTIIKAFFMRYVQQYHQRLINSLY